MRLFLFLLLFVSASSTGILGPLNKTKVEETREDRIRSEVSHVKELLSGLSKDKGETRSRSIEKGDKGLKTKRTCKQSKTGGSEDCREDSEEFVPLVRNTPIRKDSSSSTPQSSPVLKKAPGEHSRTPSPVAVLSTHGVSLHDPADQHHHIASTLEIESQQLLLEFGGVEQLISSVEAIMYNMLNDRLHVFFQMKLGSIVESVSLTLDFLEDSVTRNEEGDTIGEVEVQTSVRLHANDSSLLVGLDETNATSTLVAFFEGDSLHDLLDDLKRKGVKFSFLRLKSNTTDESEETIPAPSPKAVSMAFAVIGVLGIAVGAKMFMRWYRSTKSEAESLEIVENESEEDQFFRPSVPVYIPDQPTSSLRSTTNLFGDLYSDDDDDDSLGSERFLNWPIERAVSSRWKKSSLHDVSVDSDESSVGEIKQ